MGDAGRARPLRRVQLMESSEVFRYLHFAWDIDQAREVTRGREPDLALPVLAWANALIEPEPEPGAARTGISLFHHPVDWDWVRGEEIDLERPLLAILFRVWREETGVRESTLLIDGHHRLARARRDGVETLPLVLLRDEEERAARIRGPYPEEQQRAARRGRRRRA
jgi:hypothetical protein